MPAFRLNVSVNYFKYEDRFDVFASYKNDSTIFWDCVNIDNVIKSSQESAAKLFE